MADAAELIVRGKFEGGADVERAMDGVGQAAEKMSQRLSLARVEWDKMTEAQRDFEKNKAHGNALEENALRAARATDALAQAQNKVRDAIDSANASVGNSVGGMGQLGGIVGELVTRYGGLTAALGLATTGLNLTLKYITESIVAYREAEEVTIRLETALAVVGRNSGKTAEEIEKFANGLARVTRFDDEGIKRAATTLLRFGEVSGNTFDRALRASADLAELMGTDVTQGAEMVGRALETAYGASALRRIGVLTDADVKYLQTLKEVSSAGEYHAGVLALIEAKAQGTAERVGDRGLTGASNALRKEWEDWKEDAGKLIVQLTGVDVGLRNIATAINMVRTAREKGGMAWMLQPEAWGIPSVQPRRGPEVRGRITNAAGEDQDRANAEMAREYNEGLKRIAAIQDSVRPAAEKVNLLKIEFESLARSVGMSASEMALWQKRIEESGDKGKTAAAALKALKDAAKAAAEAQKDVEKATANREKADKSLMESLLQLTPEEKRYQAALEALSQSSASAEERERLRLAIYLKLSPEMIALTKATDAYAKEHEALIASYNKGSDSIKQEAKDTLEHAKTLNMTKKELAELTVKRAEDALATAEQTLSSAQNALEGEDEIAAIRRRIDALKDLVSARRADAGAAAQKETSDTWSRWVGQVEQSLSDALMNGFEAGKGFAQSFRDSLVNMFKTLVLRPVINFIVSPISNALSGMFGMGGQAASGGFNLASMFGGGGMGGSGGGSILGGLGSGWSSFFGNVGIEGGAASAGLAGMADLAGMPMLGSFLQGVGSPLATMSTLFGSGAGTGLAAAGGLAGVFGAALPIIGVGLLAYTLLKKKRGGPKTGGSAGYGTLADAPRWFTPNQEDENISAITSQWGTDYESIVTALGGKARKDIGFSLGYDMDPEGTAPNRLSAQLRIGDQDILNFKDRDLGRDQEALSKAIEETTMEALLAAIKATDLPSEVKKVWERVTKATQEELQTLVTLTTAMTSASKIAGRDPIKDANDSFKSMFDQFLDATTTIRDLTTSFDGSAEAAANLAAANETYYASLVEVMRQIEGARRAIGENSRGAREQIMLAGTTPQEGYDLYNQWYGSSMSRLQGLKDPQLILQEAERARQYAMSAFQSLTPEQQRARRSEYIGVMDDIDRVAQAQLDLAQEQGRTLGQEIAAAVSTALTKAATDFADSAGKMNTAATTLSNTIGDGIDLNVDVNVVVDGPGTATSNVYTPNSGGS